MGGARLNGIGHGLAVLDADIFGHLLGHLRRQHRQGLAEQAHEDVVMAHLHLKANLWLCGPVALRGASHAPRWLPHRNLEIPTR